MNNKYADILVYLSVAVALIAGAVSLFNLSFWLAGTQWMLISVILGIYAIFAKIK